MLFDIISPIYFTYNSVFQEAFFKNIHPLLYTIFSDGNQNLGTDAIIRIEAHILEVERSVLLPFLYGVNKFAASHPTQVSNFQLVQMFYI